MRKFNKLNNFQLALEKKNFVPRFHKFKNSNLSNFELLRASKTADFSNSLLSNLLSSNLELLIFSLKNLKNLTFDLLDISNHLSRMMQ